MQELEEEFGEIPWSDVRQGLDKPGRESRALVPAPGDKSNSKFVMVPTFHAVPNGDGKRRGLSEVETILESLLGLIDPSRVEEGVALLRTLRDCLQLTCGRVSRGNGHGGWQYADSFILESVLLADNLRPLQEGDLTQDTVRQSFGGETVFESNITYFKFFNFFHFIFEILLYCILYVCVCSYYSSFEGIGVGAHTCTV